MRWKISYRIESQSFNSTRGAVLYAGQGAGPGIIGEPHLLPVAFKNQFLGGKGNKPIGLPDLLAEAVDRQPAGIIEVNEVFHGDESAHAIEIGRPQRRKEQAGQRQGNDELSQRDALRLCALRDVQLQTIFGNESSHLSLNSPAT